MRHRTRYLFLPVVFAAWCLTLGPAGGQLPQIRLESLFPAGGQVGTTVPVTITASTDADEATELLFSHPAIRATARTDAAGNMITNAFDVTIDESVAPGLYDVRLRGLFGISNPRTFRIAALPEAAETEPNDTRNSAQPLSLGSIVNARSNARGDVDYFTLDVSADQTIVLKAEAASIDSTLQPVIDVLGENGRRLTTSRRVLEQDAAVVVTSDIDQRLTIKVHDLVFAGGESWNYRLIVDDRPLIDFVWPPVIPEGAAGFVEMFGRHLPAGEPSELQLNGHRLLKKTIKVPASAASGPATGTQAAAAALNTIRWNVDGNLIQLAVCEAGIPIYRDSDPIVADGRSLNGAFTVAGRFEPQGSDDIIRFFAKKGEIRDISVGSQRLGFPTSARIVIEQLTTSDDGSESLSQLATEDNGRQDPGTNQLPTFTPDPAYRLTAPAEGIYQIRIRDLYARATAQPHRLYVINVREPRPDFQLIAFESTPSTDGLAPPTIGAINLRKGGRYEVPVYVLRQSGHHTPITVTAEDLPEGVTCDSSVIRPGQLSTTLFVEATEDAPEVMVPITIVGSSEGRPDRSARVATLVHAGINGLPRTGRLTSTMLLNVVKDIQPFRLDIEQESIALQQGQQLSLKLRLTRRTGFNGKVNVGFTGLPANVDIPALAFEPDVTEATGQVNVKANAAVGRTQLLAYATATVPYRRNPWKAERAHARVAELQQQVEQQKAAGKEAQASKDRASQDLQLLTESLADLTRQEQEHAGHAEVLRKQLAESTAASLPVATIRTATSAASESESRLSDLESIEAAAREITEAANELKDINDSVSRLTRKLKSANGTLAAARNGQRDATDRRASMQQTIAAAETTIADAAQAVEQLNTKKAEAEQAAAAADEAAKPTDVNLRFPSNPVPIEIKASE